MYNLAQEMIQGVDTRLPIAPNSSQTHITMVLKLRTISLIFQVVMQLQISSYAPAMWLPISGRALDASVK